MVMAVDPDGNIEWQSPKWMQARGSHDQTFAVRPTTRGELHISGCPAKFLQGHNVFGTDDFVGLLLPVFSKLVECLDLKILPHEWDCIEHGYVNMLRADINYSYSTGCRSNALAWIRGAELHGHLQHRGRGMLSGSSVTWGKGSRYWGLKAYCKGQEIEAKGHRLPIGCVGRGLEEWADDKLRIELQMRARTLREHGLDVAANWKSGTARDIFVQHLAKLSLSGEARMDTEELDTLPRGVRMTYLAWKAGEDVRSVVSRPTFYRYRKQLLAHGIDIAVASPNPNANVVPLIRCIEAVPADVPGWAHGTDLYFEPRRVA